MKIVDNEIIYSSTYQKIYQIVFWIFVIASTSFIAFFIYAMYSFSQAWSTHDYEENTDLLKTSAAGSLYIESRVKLPLDAEIIHVSEHRAGPNTAYNLIFKVNDIGTFLEEVSNQYLLENKTIQYPMLNDELISKRENGNISALPFCEKVNPNDEFDKLFAEKMNQSILVDFCKEQKVLFTQVEDEVEIGKIMVVFPNQKMVWFNSSYWF